MILSFLSLVIQWHLVVSPNNKVAHSWYEVQQKGEGVLAIVYYTQPGLIYKDVNGNMKGLCVDIVNDFVQFVQINYGKRLTVSYLYEEPVFSRFLETIKKTPKVMGVSNITITEQRKKTLKFTPYYLVNPIVLLSHKSVPDIKLLSEVTSRFATSTGIVVNNSTHQEYMQEIKMKYLPTLQIQKVEAGHLVMNEIAKKQNLFTVVDLTEFVYALRNNLPVKRHPVNVLDKYEELAFAMESTSDWDQPWNAFLTASYRASMPYKKHVLDNLGSSFLTIMEEKK